MSFAMFGIGVSGGIAIGPARLLSHTSLEVAHYAVPEDQFDREVARFDSAVSEVRGGLESLRETVPPGAPAEVDAFLQLHLMILNDSTLSEAPRALIVQQGCNAEWALKQQMDNLIRQFEAIEDTYLRERQADVVQVVERVLKALLGTTTTVSGSGGRDMPGILVAHDLSPADMMLFKQQSFAAFITDVGGATSHTAIMARSLNIPSVVALHHAWPLVRENEILIVDGRQGVVLVNPDRQVLTEYRLRQEQWDLERQKLKRLRSTRATTLDGVDVQLHANIELPADVDQVRKSGATGIGLFRSEFLFMNRPDLPDENEQFAAYRAVAEAMRGMPVTIRSLDIGNDKPIEQGPRVTNNPALGLRAVRYCLSEPRLFNAQLRAILRASHYGKVRLLIPMLCSRAELDQTLAMLDQARAQLREEGVPFDEQLPVGGMIEIPAAALALEALLERLDFLSIGTNDLIQYTLAIDRTDDSVAHLYDPLHPAVLFLIAHVIRTANKHAVPVSVCGEMAGDPQLTRLLLGFGLRNFSMHPNHLPMVKQVVLTTTLADTESTARRILSAHTQERISQLLGKLNA
ncbi:MAG: phosphoenolpyruvate--protein phosphotransferase [Pseudomonadota bacterium]|nr:phosphoenolpyruvate--protein phosphotransferase [Pseudomonadota bacterium]